MTGTGCKSFPRHIDHLRVLPDGIVRNSIEYREFDCGSNVPSRLHTAEQGQQQPFAVDWFCETFGILTH